MGAHLEASVTDAGGRFGQPLRPVPASAFKPGVTRADSGDGDAGPSARQGEGEAGFSSSVQLTTGTGKSAVGMRSSTLGSSVEQGSNDTLQRGGGSADPARETGPRNGLLAGLLARIGAAFTMQSTIPLREIEQRLWPWRLIVGLVFLASLFLPVSRVEALPFGTAVASYLLLYSLLRMSTIRCPAFCLLLFALDLGFVTAAAYFSGGAQSVFAFMYVLPIAVMAVARGTRAAIVLATAAMLLRLATAGPLALGNDAPRDAFALVAVLYGVAFVVGRSHAAVAKAQTDLARGLVDLHRGMAELSGEGSVTGVLDQSVALATRLTGATYGAISVWDSEGESVYLSTAGLDPAQAARLGKPPTRSGLLERVSEASDPVRIDDVISLAARQALPDGHPPIKSLLEVPFPSMGGWNGAFYMINKKSSGHFELADEHLGEMLAAHVATAVAKRRLAESQREMHDGLLEMLVKISDAREHALSGHSERVRRYARGIAEGAGLAGEDLELVATAGLLHDIGKIAVPEHILGKPGPLDDEERSLMMSHSAIGAEIVAQAGPLGRLAPLVRHHHERFDGKGYPDGLAGEAIPLGARILAIADALDAMASDRPYRPRRGIDGALAEIARSAGSQFDPELAALVPAVVAKELGTRREVRTGAPARDQPTLAELHSSVQAARWRLFTRMASEIDAVADLPRLSEHILSLLCEDLPVSGGMLGVLDGSGESLVLIAEKGDLTLLPVGSVLRRGVGVLWAVFESRESLVVDDIVAHPLYAGVPGTRSGAGIYLPLAAGDRMVGVLVLHRRLGQTFGEQERAYLEAVAAPVAELLLVAKLHADLEQAAMTDSLTNAGSRRYGLEQLAMSCARAERSQKGFAVILLDLDEFKQINDTYGHQAGDAVLGEAVRLLRERLRTGDLLARYGGDEFMVVTSEAETASQAAALIERLVERSPVDHLVIGGRSVPLPPWSAGMATFPVDGSSVDDLLRVADSRLYAAKRGRVQPRSQRQAGPRVPGGHRSGVARP